MRKAKVFIAATLFAVFVLTYAHTCSLSVSWKNFSEDSGDLLAAAYTLGIPHPTGYPLYVLLGRIFSLVMPGSIAFRITLLSLLCASVAPVFLFLTMAKRFPYRIGLMSATLASLSLGFSLHVWSLAVVAEVYALNLLLMSAIVYLILEWTDTDTETAESPGASHAGRLASRESSVALPPSRSYHETSGAGIHGRRNAYLVLSAYILGLSFANHMLSIVTLLFAVVFVLSGSGRRHLSLSLLLRIFLFFVVPITLYAFLPIRSLRNPDLDWGNPESWNQFKWLVTGAQYRFRFLGTPLGESISKLWPGPFLGTGWLVLVFSAIGVFSRKLTASLRAALASAIAANLAIVVLYEIPDFPAYFLPTSFSLCFLAGAGFLHLVESINAFLQRTRKASLAGYATTLIAVSLAIAAILPPAIENGKEADASTDLYPYVFGRATFKVVEPNALIVSEYDGRTFALWFFHQTEFRETHPECIVVLKYLLVWPWYIDNLKNLYPDLPLPRAGAVEPAMISLVMSNLEERPIYTVRDDPALKPFFHLRPVLGGETPLFRVEKKGGLRAPSETVREQEPE